jgi:hypothetical protein
MTNRITAGVNILLARFIAVTANNRTAAKEIFTIMFK